jgi:hypothetical protein
VNYILTFVIKWTVIADPSHTVVQMPAMSPTMVRYAKICEELSLKCYLHVCVCVIFVASKKFCDPNCYYFVQSQGNIAKWRKKEGDKVSYTKSFI